MLKAQNYFKAIYKTTLYVNFAPGALNTLINYLFIQVFTDIGVPLPNHQHLHMV